MHTELTKWVRNLICALRHYPLLLIPSITDRNPVSKCITPGRFEDVRELPSAKPLDERVRQTWVLKGRVREEGGYAARMKAIKWISLAGLLLVVAAGSWSQVASYNVGVRFLVAMGALVLMFHAIHMRHLATGAVFGALALLFNPVAPVFSFSGEWQRAALVASAIPFVALLTWRNAKLRLVPNE